MSNPKVCLLALNKHHDLDFKVRLQECAELIEAADFELVSYLTQASDERMPLYVGTGKIEELKALIEKDEIEIVATLDELSPSQHRNLEQVLEITVIDRTQIIFMIFNRRAFSNEAKLQVEAARLSYLLPRLKTHLTSTGRQQGGSMRNRGSGESQLEIHRRGAMKQYARIQKELKQLENVRETQALARRKADVLIVALVGYTNVGKSSLMNTLLTQLTHKKDKDVIANDRLFETLGTASRFCTLNGIPIVLTDTVGFVSDLPHSLVIAFHSTLQEVNHADLLIHVLDSSSDQIDHQQSVTLSTLKEIGADSKPMITVYNKVDLKEHAGLAISAHTGFGITELIERIEDELRSIQIQTQLCIPFDKKADLDALKESYKQLEIREAEEGYIVNLPYPLKDDSPFHVYKQKEKKLDYYDHTKH